MTDIELEKYIDTYGGDIDIWPKAERRQAYAYLDDFPEKWEILKLFQKIEKELSPKTNLQNYSYLVDNILSEASVEQTHLYMPKPKPRIVDHLIKILSHGLTPFYMLSSSFAFGLSVGGLMFLYSYASPTSTLLYDNNLAENIFLIQVFGL